MSRFRKHDLPRMKWLRSQHAMRVLDVARSQEMSVWLTRSHQRAFDYLLAFDPTPKGIYVARIVDWFCAGKIRLEDARIVRDILESYHAAKHRLPPADRDIGKFPDPGSVAKMLDGSTDWDLPQVPPHLADGSVQVAGDGGWAIHRITTPDAATWWAKGTTWCTRKPGTASDYLAKDPLHVVVVGKDKWQFHVDSAQFANRYDQMIKEFPELPSAAVEAALSIASTPADPCAAIHRMDLQRLLEDESSRRKGTLPENPDRPRFKETWLLRDSGTTIIETGSALEFVPFIKGADGRHVRFDSEKGAAITTEYVRQRILRAAKGEDGSHDPKTMTWFQAAEGRVDHRMGIVLDGEAVAMAIHARHGEGRSGLILHDLRHTPAEIHVVATESDFKALDPTMQECVRRSYERVAVPIDMLCRLGFDILNEKGLERFNRNWLRPQHVASLNALIEAGDETTLERAEMIIRLKIQDAEDAKSFLYTASQGENPQEVTGPGREILDRIAQEPALVHAPAA